MSQVLLTLLSQPVEQDEANRNSILSTVAILVGIAAGLVTLAGFLRSWAKKRVEELIEENNQTREKLNTRNGKTIADYLEESHQANTKMCAKLDKYHRESMEALTLARANRESLDRHLEGHPPKGT